MSDIITSQINNIEANPEWGTRLFILHFFIGISLGLLKDGHINPLIMDVFQLGAWTTAIVVGFFTLKNGQGQKKLRMKPK
jgi:hypothetical protein